MTFDIDASQYREFGVDLGKVPARFLKDVEAVVAKGSLNIKQDAAEKISGHAHLPHYPKSISYDIKRTFTTIEGEIGPDKGRMQGPLGNILEYGTPKNRPLPHLAPALDAEEERFVNALERLFDNLLEG
jgi:hypothetical protein